MIPVTTHGPNSYNARWTSHARGRFGYAFDNWLVFATGGFAASDLSFQEGVINTTFVPASTSGGKYYGWSVGGGVEKAITSISSAVLNIFMMISATRITSAFSATIPCVLDRPQRARGAGVEIRSVGKRTTPRRHARLYAGHPRLNGAA